LDKREWSRKLRKRKGRFIKGNMSRNSVICGKINAAVPHVFRGIYILPRNSVICGKKSLVGRTLGERLRRRGWDYIPCG